MKPRPPFDEDEYDRLQAAYDPADRLMPCPDPDASTMVRMEFTFAIPVEMTQDQQGRLLRIIDEIISSPWNCPKEGVHWMAGVGSKTHWSRVDSALLGITPEPDAPSSGNPTYDDSIYCVESCARAFGSDHERNRKIERRGDHKEPAVPTLDKMIVDAQRVRREQISDHPAYERLLARHVRTLAAEVRRLRAETEATP